MTKARMKKLFGKLHWNVLRHDFNSHKFEVYDIMREDVLDDIYKLKDKSYEAVKEAIRKWAMYHYWSKCEYEFIVTDLWNKDEEKIDAFRQIDMNLDRLTEYVMRGLELL